MDEIGHMIQQIKDKYLGEENSTFPYQDLKELQSELANEFNKYAPNESVNADLNTYWMFIAGLAAGGLEPRLRDALERYKTKLWLEKYFFEWFPKYRFLQRYDLGDFTSLNQNFKLHEEIRMMLLRVIERYERKSFS